MVVPLLYNEIDARMALGGLGRSKFYELVSSGAIRPTKIGRRTFVAADELERFVAALADRQDARIGSGGAR